MSRHPELRAAGDQALQQLRAGGGQPVRRLNGRRLLRNLKGFLVIGRRRDASHLCVAKRHDVDDRCERKKRTSCRRSENRMAKNSYDVLYLFMKSLC